MIHYDHIKTAFPDRVRQLEQLSGEIVASPRGPHGGFNALCEVYDKCKMHPSVYVINSCMAMYHVYGQQVFEIGPRMLDMLSRTDLYTVPVEDIRLPYDAVYIDFSKSNKFHIWGGNRTGLHTVIGMYVVGERDAGDGIGLTVAAFGKENDKSVCVGDDATAWASLYLHNGDDIETRITGLLSKSDPVVPLDIEPAPMEYATMQAESLRCMFRVAINLSLYLSTPDAEVDIIHDGRRELLERKKKHVKNPGKKKRYTTQLANLSNARRHAVARTVELSTDDSGVSTHWVRGHWHTYWTGSGRTIKTRKWVMPFIRGKGDVTERHTYNVKEG